MNVIVFGATGNTGLEIVQQSLAKGFDVTAFVRDPVKMTLKHDALRLVAGDVLDLNAVKEAVDGQDAVACSLGTKSLSNTTLRSAGTANIIKAMAACGVQRLLVVSAMGIGDSWSTLSTGSKIFFNTVLRSAKIDHEEQERLVRESDLDWTIVRPSGLTDEPITGSYDAGENIMANSSRIPCADVAHFVVNALADHSFTHKAITVTN